MGYWRISRHRLPLWQPGGVTDKLSKFRTVLTSLLSSYDIIYINIYLRVIKHPPLKSCKRFKDVREVRINQHNIVSKPFPINRQLRVDSLLMTCIMNSNFHPIAEQRELPCRTVSLSIGPPAPIALPCLPSFVPVTNFCSSGSSWLFHSLSRLWPLPRKSLGSEGYHWRLLLRGIHLSPAIIPLSCSFHLFVSLVHSISLSVLCPVSGCSPGLGLHFYPFWQGEVG